VGNSVAFNFTVIIFEGGHCVRVEMVEYPKEVSIGEDAKLCGEHKENMSGSKERLSVGDVVEITGCSCRAFVQDKQERG
jgi:hypothetical protein